MHVVPILAIAVMKQIFALLQPSKIRERVEARQFGIMTCGDLVVILRS